MKTETNQVYLLGDYFGDKINIRISTALLNAMLNRNVKIIKIESNLNLSGKIQLFRAIDLSPKEDEENKFIKLTIEEQIQEDYDVPIVTFEMSFLINDEIAEMNAEQQIEYIKKIIHAEIHPEAIVRECPQEKDIYIQRETLTYRMKLVPVHGGFRFLTEEEQAKIKDNVIRYPAIEPCEEEWR